jgi:hypothetical protein
LSIKAADRASANGLTLVEPDSVIVPVSATWLPPSPPPPQPETEVKPRIIRAAKGNIRDFLILDAMYNLLLYLVFSFPFALNSFSIFPTFFA